MNAIPDSCELDFSGRFPTLAEVERVKEGLAKLFGESTIEGTHSEYTLSAARGGLEVTEEGKRLRRFVDSVSQENGWPQWAKWCWAAARMPGYIAGNGRADPVQLRCPRRVEPTPTGNMPWVESMFDASSSGQRVVLA